MDIELQKADKEWQRTEPQKIHVARGEEQLRQQLSD